MKLILSEYHVTAIQFSLPLALYFGIGAGLHWWLFAALMSLLYIMIGNNLAMHRYYSHAEFELGPISKFIFGFFSTTLAIGSQCAYAYLHIQHHKYPESGPDWTWKDLPFYKHIWFDPKTVPPLNSRYLVELRRKYGWIHQYHIAILIAYVGLLYLINPKLALFGWWIPVTVAMAEIALAVYFQHRHAPINSKWHKFVPTWEGLHKNHHDYPMSCNNAKERGQVDYTYILSKLFVVKYNENIPNK